MSTEAIPIAVTAFHVAQAGTSLRELRNLGTVPLGRRLPIPGARPFDAASSHRDLAAFLVAVDYDGPVLSLAPSAPAAGDTVWLCAAQSLGKARWRVAEPAVVAIATDTLLAYVFVEKRLALGNTSGAPVVNADGQVVGLNVAGMTGSEPRWRRFGTRYQGCCARLRGSQVMGFAVPLVALRAQLSHAILRQGQ